MMFVAGIIIIILSGFLFDVGIRSNKIEERNSNIVLGILTLFIGTNIVCAAVDANKSVPAAFDEHQEKTMLQITYRDSIPIDTIVVYK